MTSSGVFNFGTNTPFYDIVTEAYERIGIQASKLSTNDLASARRSLQYLVTGDWSNRGPNLWTIEVVSSALTASQSTYTFSAENVDVIDAYIRQTSGGTSQDYLMSGISMSEYDAIPNKSQTSNRPTQYFFDRLATPVAYFWPLPQDATCTAYFRVMNAVEDIGDYGNTIDAPQRWFEAMASGLAAKLAIKWAPDRYDRLQLLADQAFAAATAEDTENVALRLVPDNMGRRWA